MLSAARSGRYTVAYTDLYNRYVIVYDTATDRYSRYNITARGKYILASTGSYDTLVGRG